MQLPSPALLPLDSHNRRLWSNVHPRDWVNPKPAQPYHLVVIGAGTAGLVTAAGAAGLGARVALIEKSLMGGDCLNVGCVPSKALLAAAHSAWGRFDADRQDADRESCEPAFSTSDFSKVMESLRAKRADISPHDSAERFRELGVDVFFGEAQFRDEGCIEVVQADSQTVSLNYRKAVIATGARASAPPISGLDSVPYLTNETLFSLTERPRRLAIIGGGPIGCEMAQAFRRLGSEVVLIEVGERLLGREDPEASAILQEQFRIDGIELKLTVRDLVVEPAESESIRLGWTRSGRSEKVVADRLLVAAGRTPNVERLNLDAIGVATDRGIQVDDTMRTTNRRVFAAGDVCSRFQFTHAADFQARIVIQNALFALGPVGRKRASDLIIPWATYTAPEIAHVGITAQEALDRGSEIRAFTQSMTQVDRAILEGETDGFVKIYVPRRGDRILGATAVGKNAGDWINQLTMAMTHRSVCPNLPSPSTLIPPVPRR